MGYAATNRIQDKAVAWSDSATHAMQHGAESAREAIVHNPASAVFTAFGAGLGVGIGLALVFGGRPAPTYDYGLRDKVTQFLSEHFPWTK